MGMFVACQNELIRALKAAGCGKEPYTSRKKLLSTAESRVSAVLCEEEAVERDKQKKAFVGAGGEHLKRSKMYSRDITYLVIIGDYSNEKSCPRASTWTVTLPPWNPRMRTGWVKRTIFCTRRYPCRSRSPAMAACTRIRT